MEMSVHQTAKANGSPRRGRPESDVKEGETWRRLGQFGEAATEFTAVENYPSRRIGQISIREYAKLPGHLHVIQRLRCALL